MEEDGEEENDIRSKENTHKSEMKKELGTIRKRVERMQRKMYETDIKWKGMEERLKEQITKSVVEII